MSNQFNGQNNLIPNNIINISYLFKYQIVLFDPKTGSYQVLPFRVKLDLGAMFLKR